MKPVKIFIAHAPEDEQLKEALEEHLAMLKRGGVIDAWHDGRIVVGNAWETEKSEMMLSSDIILPLISSDFLASDETFSATFQKAIDMHHKGQIKVIPVLLRDCLWSEGQLANLQPLPLNRVPVTSNMWDSEDAGMKKVAEEIKRISISIKERDGQPFVSGPPKVTHVGQLEEPKTYSRRWLFGGLALVATLLLMGLYWMFGRGEGEKSGIPTKKNTPTSHEQSTIQDDEDGAAAIPTNNTKAQLIDVSHASPVVLDKVKTTVTRARLERLNSKKNKLIFDVTCESERTANIMKMHFRLKTDGLRNGPSNNVNQIVKPKIPLNVTVEFEVPAHVNKAELIFYRGDESDVLPISWNVSSTTPYEEPRPEGTKVISPNGTVRFLDGDVVYRIHKVFLEPYNGGDNLLRIQIVNTVKGGSYNLWKRSFRLKANGVISEPTNNLNTVIESNEDLIGELTFTVPKDADKAELFVDFRDEESSMIINLK